MKKSEDRILIYKSINQKHEGIVKIPGTSQYSVSTARRTWVFPWIRKILLNVEYIYDIDDTIIMLIENDKNEKAHILPRIMAGEKQKLYVYAKSKGILPRRINVEEHIVTMVFLELQDCYILNQDT